MDIMWNAFILAFAFAAALFPSLASAPIAPNTPALSVRALPQPRATIIFGGDMMFDRTVRTAMEKNGDDFIFSCIDPVLADADLVVANLEGPITSHASVSATSSPEDEYNYTFTFPVSTASLLRRHGIGMVNIGNNHIMNFGREGLVETRKWLDAAGVGYFGDPDAVEADRVARMTIGGVPFSFVNWSDWTSDKTDHTVAQVRREALEGRVAVVYAHWGDEYVPPPERVKRLAHSFVDAGAALVVGSHPHIVQEHEKYKDTDVYYSLGNFIFDQYWSDEVRRGLLLRVVFGPEGVESVKEIPIEFGHDRRTCVIP